MIGRRLVIATMTMVLLAVGATAAASAMAATVTLEPPAAAALLGPSCGGVHVATYALGFDADDRVLGVVHAWTRCATGTGRLRRTRLYQSWHTLVWDLQGTLLEVRASDPAAPDPRRSAADAAGNLVATRSVAPNAGLVDSVAVLTTR